MRVARLLISAGLGLCCAAVVLHGLAASDARSASAQTAEGALDPQPVLTATLFPSKDNTLFESADGSLSNGAAPFFFVGRTGQIENYTRRGLLAFNLAATIPPGSAVLTATFVMTISKTAGGTVTPPVPQVIGLHRLTADWGEGTSNGGGSGASATPGDATWLHRTYSSTLWSTAGGDFVAAASATQTVGTTYPLAYTWTATSTLVADVQGWVNAPSTNFGWLLRGDELTTGSAQRFYSRESDPTTRPVLIVQYTLPPFSLYLPLLQR